MALTGPSAPTNKSAGVAPAITREARSVARSAAAPDPKKQKEGIITQFLAEPGAKREIRIDHECALSDRAATSGRHFVPSTVTTYLPRAQNRSTQMDKSGPGNREQEKRSDWSYPGD